MLSLSLVIINYNDNDFLHKLFSSLKEQKVKFDKIFFVDNHSIENPAKFINSVKDIPIEFIRTERNIFFGPGNNIALRKVIDSKVDIIGIINPDMYFEKDCFRNILGYLAKNPDVVAVQPRLYKIGTTDFNSPPFKLGLKRFVSIEGNKTKETVAISGAANFVRREALLKSGLFYEPFFHYAEDAYLSYKLSLIGKTVWLYEAVGYHRVGLEAKERASPKYSLLRQLKTRNDYILSLKTFRRRPTWLIFDFVEFFKQVILFLIGYKDRFVRMDYIKGYLWGFKETFFHLLNNEKYLDKAIDYNLIPVLK